jgi:hypothetical protein
MVSHVYTVWDRLQCILYCLQLTAVRCHFIVVDHCIWWTTSEHASCIHIHLYVHTNRTTLKDNIESYSLCLSALDRCLTYMTAWTKSTSQTSSFSIQNTIVRCHGNLCMSYKHSFNVWTYRYVMKNIMVQAVTHIYSLQHHAYCIWCGKQQCAASRCTLRATAKQWVVLLWCYRLLDWVSSYASAGSSLVTVWLLVWQSQHPRQVLCDVVQSHSKHCSY